jgi:SRSO17 transposase
MDTRSYNTVCSDLPSFCDFVFDSCPGVPLRINLGRCMEARLSAAKRKTHQPAANQLVARQEDADGLRQRMNRATLSHRWMDSGPRQRLFEIAEHNVPGAVAWMIDDTGVIKKGNKSPGVQRQYCGKAGKRENCQLVVSTHLAGWTASQPLEADLYLPKVWVEDVPRRREAGIPDSVIFETKVDISLRQIDHMLAAGLPEKVVLADSAYGNSSKFRRGLRSRKLEYNVAIKPNTTIWRPGQGPDPVPEYSGMGRPTTRELPGEFHPVSVAGFALELRNDQFKRVRLWRGRHEPKELRAAFVRIRTARDAYKGHPPGDEQWLIIVWPKDQKKPSDYFLSNLGRRVRPKRLLELACLRWRVERDYQDMKQEVGLEHYEGRSWVGLHHHLTICMAAHAFLASQRKLFPPQTGRIDSVGAQENHA